MTKSLWGKSVKRWLERRWLHALMYYWYVKAVSPPAMEYCFPIRVRRTWRKAIMKVGQIFWTKVKLHNPGKIKQNQISNCDYYYFFFGKLYHWLKVLLQFLDCDVQLFFPSGLIENPVRSSSSSFSNMQSCRVFIDGPPALKIQIRALSVFNTTSSDSTYVLVREPRASLFPT